MSKIYQICETDYYKKMKSFCWDCCRITHTIARDGQVTAHNEWPGYPGQSGIAYESQSMLPGADGYFQGIYTVLDPIGRAHQNIRFVTDLSYSYISAYADQTTETFYPYGTSHYRVTTDPLGVAETNLIEHGSYYTCDITYNRGIKTIVTDVPGGATTTRQEWADPVSGVDHIKETKTESETQPDGCEKRTSYVKYDDGEWLTQSVTASDFLGRVVATTTPLGTTSSFYDSTTGRLIRVSRTGSPDVLYFYDELGEQTETCVDINSNGAVDYSGTDQITTRSTYYQEISTNWWQVSSSAVYFQTNSTSTITTSVSRVRMTGLGVDTCNGGVLTAQSESEDWLGNITRSSTYTDAANVTTWQVTDTPISTQNAFQKSIAGYPVQEISVTSVTNAFTYDGFARQVTATDGRTNTTTTVYNDLGQVAYIEDAATNRSSFAYNNLGQRTMVSNALGQVSHTAYNPQGQTIATWGTTYPVAYQFDTAGRLIAMATTRSNAYENVNLNTFVSLGDALNDCNAQGLDITQWQYDEATGLLTNKLYADGNGTSYTYTETGKIQTRTLARGKTTTYVYNNLGQLTDIDYSDSTPDVTFTHDRLGRIISASSSTSTRTFHYDGLTLDYETQNGDIIDRKQDSFGRTIGYILTGGPSPPMTLTYSFDEYGRLSSVTSIIGAETNTFTYTYLQGTDLVNAMSSDSGVQWSRYYESERNLIVAVSNSWDSTVISSFDYINDPLGRRTRRADYYNASTIINVFDYNIRGEVIGADMGEDNYNCEYDPIGNRKQSTVCSGQSTVT
ncbi:MAG: hypothetical protein PHY48_15515, partial [Candidatus Cloacimonetes bacterium]|nr:hypothetical protein [Candidatus Cloacimonadota bacterium]